MLLRLVAAGRQRRTAVVHLMSHCNARLQAMMPDLRPAQHPLPSSSSPLAAARATSNSPEASASDAQTQNQKLPSLSPSQQPLKGMATEQCQASAAEEEGEEQGSRAGGQCAVQGPLVEAEVGQAVAAATLELMLAVLRGSQDTGQLQHPPHTHLCTTRCSNMIVPVKQLYIYTGLKVM